MATCPGGRLKKAIGPWNELVHHSGYAGTLVEFTEPGKEPRLIEVSPTQNCGELAGSVLQGWEFQPTSPPNLRRGARTDSMGGNGKPRSPWPSKSSPSARRTSGWLASPKRSTAAPDPVPAPWGGTPSGTGWKWPSARKPAHKSTTAPKGMRNDVRHAPMASTTKRTPPNQRHMTCACALTEGHATWSHPKATGTRAAS